MVPLVSKVLQVMDDRGLIDLPLRVNGLEVRVSAVAPLAMAQNLEEINSIMQYAQIAMQVGPEGQMSIKTGEMLDMIAEKLGIPQKIRTTPEEREMMKQQGAQMAAEVAEENPELAAQAVQRMV
jgi:hypothetical protein